MHFSGSATTSSSGASVIKATAKAVFALGDFVNGLTDFIVGVIAGTTDSENNIVARALTHLLHVDVLIKEVVIEFDSGRGEFGITVVLDLPFGIGEVPLPFTLPTPVRRRMLAAIGEEMPNWPHGFDDSFNATKRRALFSGCEKQLAENDLTVRDVIGKARDVFGSLPAMAYALAENDEGKIEFAIGGWTAGGMLASGVSGEFNFVLTRGGHITLTLSVSMSFLGFALRGNAVLSPSGSVEYGLLSGSGQTPTLCSVCPSLAGSLTVEKTRAGVVSVTAAAAEITIGCFQVSGPAVFDLAGRLEYFRLEATNPSCFDDRFKQAIADAVPLVSEILGASFSVGIKSVAFQASATPLGFTYFFDVDATLQGQPKLLSFGITRPIHSANDLVAVVLENALLLADALDAVLNVFTLSFIDVALTLEPIKWGATWGDGNIAGTGHGVKADAVLQMANRAYGRVGLFGGAFGVDLDNKLSSGGTSLDRRFDLFDVELAFKLDAQVRLPIAEDLANSLGDGVRPPVPDAVTLAAEFFGDLSDKSLNKQNIDLVLLLRNTACALKDSLSSFEEEIASPDVLGAWDLQPEANSMAMWTQQLLQSMSDILIGILSTLEEAGGGIDAGMPQFLEVQAILTNFQRDAGPFFNAPDVRNGVQAIATTAAHVHTTARDMFFNIRRLPIAVQDVTQSADKIVATLRGPTSDDLRRISTWGAGVNAMRCLFQQTPDFVNRLGSLDRRLLSNVFAPLGGLGRRLFTSIPRGPPAVLLPALPQRLPACAEPVELPGNATDERLARVTFAGFDALCSSIRWVLVRLARDLGPTGRRPQSGQMTGLGAYTGFIQAVGRKRFRHASTLLLRSSACLSDSSDPRNLIEPQTDCSVAVALLQNGCDTAPRWIDAPKWIFPNSSVAPSVSVVLISFADGVPMDGINGEIPQPAYSSASLSTNFSSTNSSSTNSTTIQASSAVPTNASHSNSSNHSTSLTPSRSSHAAHALMRHTFELQLQMTIGGLAACSSNGTARLHARLIERFSMSFYSDAMPNLTAAVAHETANALYLLPDGKVAVRPGLISRWWTDHDAVYFDASSIDRLHRSASEICARAGDAANSWPATADVVVEVGAAATSRIIAAPYPVMRTLEMGRISHLPWAFHAAPSIVCQARCNRGLAPATRAIVVDIQLSPVPTAPQSMIRCLRFHQRDYSACDVSKVVADRRFQQCVGMRASLNVSYLTTLNVSVNDQARILASFDCETFTQAKARSCACSSSTDSQWPFLGSVEAAVGRIRDHRALNRPADLVSVRERLWALGYGRTTASSQTLKESCEDDLEALIESAKPPSDLLATGPLFVEAYVSEHLMRVFFCAVAGELTFEDVCDAQQLNGNCAVRRLSTGLTECPPHARTRRGTCLRLELPCTDGLIGVNSTEHFWLRAHGSPEWLQLPRRGEGFVNEGDEALIFGTSWLAEALVLAGRQYQAAYLMDSPDAEPIAVTAASGREGGKLPDEISYQTGLQLKLRLPSNAHTGQIDWTSVQNQVTALQAAGFTGLKLRGEGERAVCESQPSLCMGSNAKAGEMCARIHPPSLSGLPLLPQLTQSSLHVAAHNRSALLTLSGTSLGSSPEDVLGIAVGEYECKLSSHYATHVTATCVVADRDGWVRGRPSLTTSAGQGFGSAVLSAFLEAQLAPPVPSPPPQLPDFSGVPPRALPYVERLPANVLDAAALQPLTLEDVTLMQATLRGEEPTCLPGVDTSACEVSRAFIANPPAAPPPPPPPIVAPYPTNDGRLQPSPRVVAPQDRVAVALAGDCTDNLAYHIFAACSEQLLVPHLSVHSVASGNASDMPPPLLHFAFDHLEPPTSPHALAHSAACGNSTTLFYGAVDLPRLALHKPVPFEATLPRFGGPTDPSTGMPHGYVLSVGPVTVPEVLGVEGGGQVQLDTIALGGTVRVNGTCLGGLTRHAYLQAWLPSAHLHELLNSAFREWPTAGDAVAAPFNEGLSALTDVHVLLVDHDTADGAVSIQEAIHVGQDPATLGIPAELRALLPGLHLNATALLTGQAHELLCMSSWLTVGTYPCTQQAVQLSGLIDTHNAHMRLRGDTYDPETLLAASHLAYTAAGDAQATPFFLASVGDATLRLDDLRQKRVSPWGRSLTRRLSLSIARMGLRLPIRADGAAGSGWTSSLVFQDLLAVLLEEQIPAEHVSSMTRSSRDESFGEAASGSGGAGTGAGESASFEPAPETSSTHRYVRIVLAPLVGAPDALRQLLVTSSMRLLNLGFEISDISLDLTYSILHPAAAYQGPTMHVAGQVSARSGLTHPVEVGVQLDRLYASRTELTLTTPANGIFLFSQAAISGVDVVTLYLRHSANISPFLARQLPAELASIVTAPDFDACLASSTMHFTGPTARFDGLPNRFANRMCQVGFHASTRGTAWGHAVHISADADLSSRPAESFECAKLNLLATWVDPTTITPAVRVGVRAALASDSSFVESLVAASTWSLYRLEHSTHTAVSSKLRLVTEGEALYRGFRVRLRFDLDLSRYGRGSSRDDATISAIIREGWPREAAIDLRCERSSLHPPTCHHVSCLPLPAPSSSGQPPTRRCSICSPCTSRSIPLRPRLCRPHYHSIV